MISLYISNEGLEAVCLLESIEIWFNVFKFVSCWRWEDVDSEDECVTLLIVAGNENALLVARAGVCEFDADELFLLFNKKFLNSLPDLNLSAFEASILYL